MNTEKHSHDDSEDFSHLPSFLTGEKLKEGQEIPASYFTDLPGRIQDKIDDILLAEMAPVFSSIPKPPDPSVPEEYFNEMSAGITSGIILDKISRQIPVLPLYFEELPGEIETAIKADSLNISKEAPFKVEADYFDWLPSLIQGRINDSAPSRNALSTLRSWLTPRFMIPAGLSFALILLIGIRSFYSPALSAGGTASLNLSEKDKSEVIENFELLGFEETLVNEHLATAVNMSGRPAPAGSDAIEYLIDENADVSNYTLEN